MQLRRCVFLSVVLGILFTLGCGGKSTVDSPVGSGAEAVLGSTAQPSAATELGPALGNSTAGRPSKTKRSSKGLAKATPEQIAQWNLPEFEPFQLLACRDGFSDPAVLSLAMTADGKRFATGGAKLTLWNTKDSEPTLEMLSKYPGTEIDRPLQSMAISPDGNWIAAGDQKGTVRLWTLSDQSEVATIKAHQGRLTQLAFSPDSQRLATTSYSGEVNLWQLPEGKKLKSLKMSDQEIKRLVFLSDNLLASAGAEVAIWNIESGMKETVLTTKQINGPALAISNDRQILAFSDEESALQLWDVQSSKPIGTPWQRVGAHLIDFSHDGKWVATYSGDSNVRIRDAATGSVLQIIDADGGLTSAVKWLPDCNALLIASVQGRIRIWGTAESAETIGIEPLQLPAPEVTPPEPHRSLSTAQFQRVIDIRSFPRLPGAVPKWTDFGMSAYTAHSTEDEAEQFYRYCLGKAGWTEDPPSDSQPGLLFRKEGCVLTVSFAAGVPGPEGNLEVNLLFAGNYDARWLPKISAIESKSSWSFFSSVSYPTKAELTDVEVAMLKQFHDAGWTAYSRLASSSTEDPHVRRFSMLQAGSVLTVSIGYLADPATELFVQTNITVSNKSLPFPPDSGWIEFDASNDLQFVANTKMDLKQTAEFYDTQMAAQGWLAREAGRNFKDDKGWLPYIRGQEDVFLRLTELPGGGTRIVAGNAADSSWQLKKAASAADKKKDHEKKEKPGVQASDIKLPAGATAVKFDVDQKQIEFEVANSTPAKLGEQFVKQMESLEWKRESSGIESDDYVFITFSKERSEVQIRARLAAKKATAMISGDGILWDKPLPTEPVRISYETWLRRDGKDATLDALDEFSTEMHKIPVGAKPTTQPQ